MHDGHTHTHTHAHGGAEDVSKKDELVALLKYMISHNESHTTELDKLVAKASELGEDKASEMIKSAIESYTAGNEALAKAFDQLNT